MRRAPGKAEMSHRRPAPDRLFMDQTKPRVRRVPLRRDLHPLLLPPRLFSASTHSYVLRAAGTSQALFFVRGMESHITSSWCSPPADSRLSLSSARTTGPAPSL